MLRSITAPTSTGSAIDPLSLGAANTEADVDRTSAVLPGIVEKLRNLTRSSVRA